MPESSVPKILMLEAGEAIRERIRQLLEDQGWEVTCETDSKQALTRLKMAKDAPFHLLISNFKLPEMEGDNILKLAKSISPLTQRMLMAPAEESAMVIRAINKAQIHACIATPATDRDLIDKVKFCLTQFSRDLKYDRTKRVVPHQNKQMFVIARRLKKKNQACKEKLKAQKAEKLTLGTRLAEASSRRKTEGTLEGRIRTQEIPITVESLNAEFQTLAAFTRSLFDQIAKKSGLSPSFKEIAQIIADDGLSEKTDPPDVVRQTLRTILSAPKSPVLEPGGGLKDPQEILTLTDMVSIRVSDGATKAFIRCTTEDPDPDILTLDGILDLLREEDISFGIVEDKAIESWIKRAGKEEEEFPIALGKIPVQGKDGSVEYFFETDHTNPGKILEDGRMDFRDRGEIPFVDTGDLLAVKTPPEPGSNGMSVYGEVIHVEEALDPVFLAGSGTKLSEDELSIHANQGGQPHLDPMGEITVNPELPINGDIDFQTGNVEFNGNITVSGTVKDGFTVKGANLTAREIEGGIIDLTGDLYVSDGITDANIVSVGNIYAKFINNSTVNAFGNIIIQKEIIDSDILLSGAVENQTGVIIASKIAAKAGVEAGKIGTQSSEPAHLRVGVNDHIDSRNADLDNRLEASRERLKEIREEIELVEDEDQALYTEIMDKAQKQEKLRAEITPLKEKWAELKARKDMAGVDKTVNEIHDLSLVLKKIDQELNSIFKTQDSHARKIERYKSDMEKIEKTNKDLVLKKKGLRDFSKRTEARPCVTVQGRVTQETVIMGPNASITIRDDKGRCRISEVIVEKDVGHTIEMSISDL